MKKHVIFLFGLMLYSLVYCLPLVSCINNSAEGDYTFSSGANRIEIPFFDVKPGSKLVITLDVIGTNNVNVTIGYLYSIVHDVDVGIFYNDTTGGMTEVGFFLPGSSDYNRDYSIKIEGEDGVSIRYNVKVDTLNVWMLATIFTVVFMGIGIMVVAKMKKKDIPSEFKDSSGPRLQ